MRSAGGYSVIIEPGKRDVEHDTFTCAHCQAITFTKAGLAGPLQVAIIKPDLSVVMREVKRCWTCWEYICPRCEANGNCTPKLKCIEIEEKESRKLIW